MKYRHLVERVFSVLIVLAVAATASKGATSARIINMGYLEGGESSYHSLIRNETVRLLNEMAGDSLKFRFVPYGYGSANWHRDSSQTLARQLVKRDSIDLFITAGPWAPEDLLEAGCELPIIALHRFEPRIEGLLGANLRPEAPNLTVYYRPNKIPSDLEQLVELTGAKKIGLLFFPTGDESQQLMGSLKAKASALGVELITASEVDNDSTFAFYKSYFALKRQHPDAVYLGPLWGLDNIQSLEFWSTLSRDKMPSFSWDGEVPVQRGALATASGVAFVGESYSAASKIMRIVSGVPVWSLPVAVQQPPLLVINRSTAADCDIRLPRHILLDANVIESPEPEDREQITLAQATQHALSANPTGLAAGDRLEETERMYGAAKAGLLPQLSANAYAFHQDDNRINNSHDWVAGDGYSASLALEQTILSVEKWKSLQSARAQKQVTESELQESSLALQQSVAIAYLGYLQAYEELAIVRKDREHIRLYQEICRARSLVNPGDSTDLMRWEREWQTKTSRLIAAEYNLRTARAMLTALLNRPEDYPFALDTVSFADEKMFTTLQRLYKAAGDVEAQEKLRTALVSSALGGDPRLETYNARLNAEKHLLDENSAGVFPELKLHADYRLADSLRDYPPKFDEKNGSWGIYARLNWPLWLGGKRSADKGRLKAKISSMEYARDSISLITMEETSGALFKLFSLSERMTVTFRKRKAARPVLEAAAAEYERGSTGALELIDAQNGVAQSELEMIGIRYEFFRNMARLAGVVGWDFGKFSTFDAAFMQWLTGYYAGIKGINTDTP